MFCIAKTVNNNSSIVPIFYVSICIGCDSFGSTEYDIRIINDKSTTVVLTAKNVLDGIGL
ncbi:hypothetical protein RintRC_5646 [Richelia intracellularis]|nr:hypothetical protein RintRC_5646 [Richelia intracellularis]